MFEVFGNMDSVEEINACAAGLLEEGDTERIGDLARENGIPEFFVENYVSGGEELTDCMNAGEKRDYKLSRPNRIPLGQRLLSRGW